jgi:hypothetical protein
VLDTKSPKYLEMAQGHISLSEGGLDKKVLSQKLQGKTMEQQDGTIIGAHLRGNSFLYNLSCMGADQ